MKKNSMQISSYTLDMHIYLYGLLSDFLDLKMIFRKIVKHDHGISGATNDFGIYVHF